MILDNLTSKLRAAGIKITEQRSWIPDEHSDLNSIKEILRKTIIRPLQCLVNRFGGA